MATIYHDNDADLAPLAGAGVAVVGYGNQGRSWALNLRDSGMEVSVCVRADSSREQAVTDGFTPTDLSSANDADVVCVLVPDDVIPGLGLRRSPDALTIVASGYTLAFGRFEPAGDLGMVAPRMLGPEVRRCYEEGIGFITAVGVHRDATGRAQERVLAVAKAIGGLRQGAIELSPRQEAILDLAVEQALSPALGLVNNAFVRVMTERGSRSRRSSRSWSCRASSSGRCASSERVDTRPSSAFTHPPASTASSPDAMPTRTST